MTSLDSLTLDVPDPAAARAFHAAAFDLDTPGFRASEAPTTGFRGSTPSLVVSGPATVDSLVGTALDAGATTLEPVARSFRGYGGAVRAPDGANRTVASSAGKDAGPATRRIDRVALLLGVADVAASRRFHLDRGHTVARSSGRGYVEFAAAPGAVGLALHGRRALARNAAVAPEGSGAHRIVLGSSAEPCSDPDGFTWETVSVGAAR